MSESPSLILFLVLKRKTLYPKCRFLEADFTEHPRSLWLSRHGSYFSFSASASKHLGRGGAQSWKQHNIVRKDVFVLFPTFPEQRTSESPLQRLLSSSMLL